MPDLIGLDFETYSDVSLPDHGLDRYIASENFTPLLAGLYQPHPLAGVKRQLLDNVLEPEAFHPQLREAVEGRTVVAQNAGFEERVLDWLKIKPAGFVDSAVVARAAGAGSKLEAAAPQLLGMDKLDEGRNLIKLFAVPGKYQEMHDTRAFVADIVREFADEWQLFGEYCLLDSQLGYRLALDYGPSVTTREHTMARITRDMGWRGWPVDVELVKEMQRRYLENQDIALEQFLVQHDPNVGTDKQLNLNSLKQLKEWCEVRGVRAKSFNENNVASLLKRIEKKIDSMEPGAPKYYDYLAVRDLLRTKQILGGSSLKKLQTILDTVGADGRLRDQYIHGGAGQTMRTSGRSVQMQNLKRIGSAPADMSELEDPDSDWDNTKLAENLRQVFTSSRKDGRLIVGDFSSVESRGLAWLAGEEWKLVAYRQGKDLYKELAAKIFGTSYDQVTKSQRQTGKVGELSCGYGAGPGAVLNFAANMGVELTEGEAGKLVTDWREANPAVVALWDWLNQMLHEVVGGAPSAQHHYRDGWRIRLKRINTPASLLRQHPKGAVSVMLEVVDAGGTVFLKRVFHGCYFRGRNVGYYKPSELKTGDLWKNHYTDPKTKELRFYELYGGKLAGILTQSFCRELFFLVLEQVEVWSKSRPNIEVIGQFHDELVLDWWPDDHGIGLLAAKSILERLMSDPGWVQGFPLAAEIKDDYRYTK